MNFNIWIPHLERPEEIEVPRLDNTKFRVTGSEGKTIGSVITQVRKSRSRVAIDPQMCVIPQEED